jgi:hypothetical protein
VEATAWKMTAFCEWRKIIQWILQSTLTWKQASTSTQLALETLAGTSYHATRTNLPWDSSCAGTPISTPGARTSSPDDRFALELMFLVPFARYRVYYIITHVLNQRRKAGDILRAWSVKNCLEDIIIDG